MSTKKNKNKTKLDLLDVPDSERSNVLEKLRQILRQSAAENKLWNELLQCEMLTVNGQVVFSGETALNGLLIQNADM